jgi:hypothetical protein
MPHPGDPLQPAVGIPRLERLAHAATGIIVDDLPTTMQCDVLRYHL